MSTEEDIRMPVRRTLANPRRDLFSTLEALRMGNAVTHRTFTLPTVKVLETYVSSHKTDVYKFYTLSSFPSLPYACAFSNASKRGESSTLAVATEHGIVDIINTAEQREWEQDGTRKTLEIHDNGIFDVKWSPNDRLLATASGDTTVRICDPHAWQGEPLRIMSEHSSSIKCLAWDPNHNELLASAGRDGCICLWDLRESHKRELEDDMDIDGDFEKATIKVPFAHEPVPGKATKRGRMISIPRSVTSLVYSPITSYEIISSGSADGILRKWDLRCGVLTLPNNRSKKSSALPPVDEAVVDLTMAIHSATPSSAYASLVFPSKRSRGITSLALGRGPTAGKVFALATDSRVYTYNPRGAADLPLSIPQSTDLPYSHRCMSTNSFYIRIGTSPCGRWLASGGAHGSAFVFDVASRDSVGVELRGQKGEVSGLDWAENSLATCADDGTIRIWRPDIDQYRTCCDNQERERHAWSWGEI